MADKISIKMLKSGQTVRVNSGILGTDGRHNGEQGIVDAVDTEDTTVSVKFDSYIGWSYWVWPDENRGFDIEILEDVQP